MKSIISENSKLKNLVVSSEELFQNSFGITDYQKITDNLLNISDAKYAVFVKYEEKNNSYKTMSISGPKENLEKISSIFGHECVGKEWQIDSLIEKKLKSSDITYFSGIHGLMEKKFPEDVIRKVSKAMNSGQMLAVNISRDDINIGYFILVMPQGVSFKNEELIEIYKRQVGLAFERKKAQDELEFQLRFQKMVSEISAGFLSIADEDTDEEVYNALKTCGELFNAERSYIILFSDDSKIMGVVHEWLAEGIESHMEKIKRLKISDFPWFERKIRTSEYVYVPDTEQLPDEANAERTIWSEFAIKSMLNIPLTRSNEVIGFMGFNSVCKKQSWTEYHISLLKIVAGIISSAFERKWEKKQLLEREIQLNNAQRIGHTGSWEFNMDTGKVNASEEALDIYGITGKKDILITEVQALVLPEYRHMLDKALYDLVECNKYYEVEFCIRRPHDSRIRHIHSIAEYDPVRNVVEGTIQDITEQKHAQLQLQKKTEMLDMALEATRAGIWDVDLSTGKIVLHRLDIWEKITGYTIQDFPEFNLDIWKQITHPEDIGIVVDNFEKMAKDQSKYYMEEYRMLHKNGQWIWVRAHGKISQYDKSGKPLHVYGTHISIDENKKAEQKARNASMAKSEFLTNISHEMRTPLNGIIGFSDLLLQTELSDLQLHYLKTVNTSASSLLDLINDVLDISKIEAGKLELDPERIDIIELCEQIADMLKYRIHQKNLELLLNISPRLPRYVIADRLRIRQVLVNLLGNASKFTHEGEIEFKIEASSVTERSDEMDFTFSVRDTGIGIAEESQLRIFESFSQADGSITRRYGGTGLGLSISNKLLEKMNSKLELKSREGEGSEFYFTVRLPAEQKQKEETEIPHELKTVLIADDNQPNCGIIQEMLGSMGIKSDVAESCNELTDMLRKNNDFNLVIIDRDLPLPSQYETLPEVFSDLNRKIPIILMYNSTNISFNCFTSDKIIKYTNIVKPVTQGELIKAVNSSFSVADVIPSEESGYSSEVKSQHEYRILISEDNETNRILTTAIISNLLPEAKVLHAENGNSALKMYNEHHPDIIFMDLQMPEVSGYKATAMIREIEAEINIHTPIIALTAGAVSGERERCIEAGMDDYLSKPIISDNIAVMLNKWLLKKDEGKNPLKNGLQRNKVHFDRKIIQENTGDNREIQKELVLMALSSFEKKYTEMEQAFLNDDTEGMKSTAHNIKGTALNVGFNILADLSSKFESIEDTHSKEMKALMTAIKEEIMFIKAYKETI